MAAKAARAEKEAKTGKVKASIPSLVRIKAKAKAKVHIKEKAGKEKAKAAVKAKVEAEARAEAEAEVVEEAEVVTTVGTASTPWKMIIVAIQSSNRQRISQLTQVKMIGMDSRSASIKQVLDYLCNKVLTPLTKLLDATLSSLKELIRARRKPIIKRKASSCLARPVPAKARFSF